MATRSVALVLVLYRIWRRLPPGQRRQLRGAVRRHGFRVVRRHGPRIAWAAARRARSRL